MTIYFANAGCIDLDTIRTMGVSVKSESAIGYFGTGVKYAIATLLRTGHKVELDVEGETYVFSTKTKEIRGKEFQLVYMNDEQLAYTTDLGRDWEVWMAYRELHSNCLDEGGKISKTAWEAQTTWRISGPEIEEAFNNRHQIFVHGEPSWVGDGIEVHRGSSNYIFYRGVRVHHMQKKTRMTYNITCNIELTEDRTAKSGFDLMYKLSSRLPAIAEPEFLAKLLNPSGDYTEGSLDFDYCGNPSEEFLDEAEKHISNEYSNKSAKQVLLRNRKVAKNLAHCTAQEEMTIADSLLMLKKLDTHLLRTDINVVEHLGPGIYGKMEDGEIFVTKQSIANGVDFMMITLYEEALHRDMNLRDESRAMQQYLFDKILKLVKEL